MSWLEKRAAELINGNTHDCDSCDAYDLYPHLRSVAETLAREFAEMVLRDAMADWSLYRYDKFSGADVDKFVESAIAEADKE